MAPKEKSLFCKERSSSDNNISVEEESDNRPSSTSIPLLPTSSSSSSSNITKQTQQYYFPKETRVFETADGAPYVVCNSRDAFVNPTTPSHMTPQTINSTLNLTLGISPNLLSYRSATSSWILSIVAFLDTIFVSWWETCFFYSWSNCIPTWLRKNLIFTMWKIYVKMHVYLLYKSTGLHPSVSVEYHALTTLFWWSQFMVITPRRIRFSVGQLHTVSVCNVPPEDRYQWIAMNHTQILQQNNVIVPETQISHCTVKGLYIHCNNKDIKEKVTKDNRKILFWIYGGAYLAGDCWSNSAAAYEFGSDCNIDNVFIPHFRLAPESTIDDVLWDICLAYYWVCHELVNDPTKQISIVGLSSGGAIGLRLMQLINERNQEPKLSTLPSFLESLIDSKNIMQQPSCALFFGPYVDYTEPKKGSFLHYAKHDLVVSEAVQHYGLPYLNNFIPKLGPLDEKNNYNGTGRLEYSPVYRSMNGLPPLCLVVSEHETTYDMTIQVVNNARAAGVDVTVGVWKYMCHVFSFLQAFIPEGKLSIDFGKEWLRRQQK